MDGLDEVNISSNNEGIIGLSVELQLIHLVWFVFNLYYFLDLFIVVSSILLGV